MMVADKAFVCLCEDVTIDELRKVIRMGYRDIEEIKRITGIGTGPCQGKQCLQVLRQMLAKESGIAIADIRFTTLRPPIVPIRFGQWSAGESGESQR